MEVQEQTEVDATMPEQSEPKEPEPIDDLIGNAIRFAINQHICQD